MHAVLVPVPEGSLGVPPLHELEPAVFSISCLEHGSLSKSIHASRGRTTGTTGTIARAMLGIPGFFNSM